MSIRRWAKIVSASAKFRRTAQTLNEWMKKAEVGKRAGGSVRTDTGEEVVRKTRPNRLLPIAGGSSAGLAEMARSDGGTVRPS
jgi:transposase-like protein